MRVVDTWAAGGSDGATCTTAARSGAASSPLGFRSAAAGAATFREKFGELVELHCGCVSLGQFSSQGIHLGERLAQEVEDQLLTVEEKFDFGQRSRNVVLGEERFTVEKGLLTVPFQASQQKIVFYCHPAKNGPLGATAEPVVLVINGRENLAHFETAFGAANDAYTASITVAIARAEARDLSHHAKTNPVLA